MIALGTLNDFYVSSVKYSSLIFVIPCVVVGVDPKWSEDSNPILGWLISKGNSAFQAWFKGLIYK